MTLVFIAALFVVGVAVLAAILRNRLSVITRRYTKLGRLERKYERNQRALVDLMQTERKVKPGPYADAHRLRLQGSMDAIEDDQEYLAIEIEFEKIRKAEEAADRVH